MPHSVFSLQLTKRQLVPFYNGSRSRIMVKTEAGSTISLPWRVLQPYVTTSGLSGSFVITYDATGKWKEIRKM
jgi:hypothetical protein